MTVLYRITIHNPQDYIKHSQ